MKKGVLPETFNQAAEMPSMAFAANTFRAYSNPEHSKAIPDKPFHEGP